MIIESMLFQLINFGGRGGVLKFGKPILKLNGNAKGQVE